MDTATELDMVLHPRKEKRNVQLLPKIAETVERRVIFVLFVSPEASPLTSPMKSRMPQLQLQDNWTTHIISVTQVRVEP